MSREVEGLPWPEGDPGGLNAMGTHAAGLANALESRQNFLKGLDPLGWIGDGRDNFAIDLVQHAGALQSGINAMQAASGALLTLARVVQDAQHTVLDAARKLKKARDDAHTAQVRAESARAEAIRQDSTFALLTAGLGPGVQSPADAAATRAENAAAAAQTHALQVEAWAQGQARKANEDVRRQDRICANVLEHQGLVTAPGVSTPMCTVTPPGQPLTTLGHFLLGSGSSTDGSLMDTLSQPAPPPPPPPKPVKHEHHSWWQTGLLGAATVGLTIVDAAQLGADPLTDGATVAVGEATVDSAVTESVAADAAVDSAATDAAAADATIADGAAGTITESADEVIAAEGDPGAGLPVEDGPVDPSVSDPSAPPTRPSWRDSEQSVSQQYKDQGYRDQVSFKDGSEVKYGTKGSSRPELYKPGSSVEVKNYDVTTSAGRSRLLRNVSDQALKRVTGLPEGTQQSLVVDVRGQAVTPETLDDLASRIAARTGGSIPMERITFLR